MRRDEPDRHGRAADALIATYVRELLADDVPAPARSGSETSAMPAAAPALGLAMPAAERAADVDL